jgi:hypothetical protein
MSEQDSNASPLWIWFGIILFGVLGALMLAHGLGLYDATWLNPNPDVPRFIFSIVGLIMLLAVPLMLAQLRSIDKRIVNVAGWSVVALGFVVAHWMVFYATGGSCSFDGIAIALGLPDILCKGLFGGVLLLIDLVALLIAGRVILRWFSSTARS